MKQFLGCAIVAILLLMAAIALGADLPARKADSIVSKRKCDTCVTRGLMPAQFNARYGKWRELGIALCYQKTRCEP